MKLGEISPKICDDNEKKTLSVQLLLCLMEFSQCTRVHTDTRAHTIRVHRHLTVYFHHVLH